MMCSPTGKGGFTLVELVVVLVAVLVIASIVYPIFIKSHDHHYEQCPSNIKQLALAIQLYSQDNGYQYPGIDGTGWVDKIAPYVGGSSDVFVCDYDTSGVANPVSYAMSGLLIREDGTGVRESQVISPSEVSALCDATPTVVYPDGLVIGGGAQKRIKDIGAEPVLRHYNGLVVGFVDGHARYFQGNIDKANEGNGAMRALYHAAPLELIDNPTACMPDGCGVAGSGVVALGGEYAARPFLLAAGQMFAGDYYNAGFRGEYNRNGQNKGDGWVWGAACTGPAKVAKKAMAYDAVCIIVSKSSKIPSLPPLKNSTHAVTIPTIRRLFETGWQQNTVQVYRMPGAWCGTNAYVKKVIGNSGWGIDSLQVADDAEMVEKITNDPYGIGYCSSAFADPDRVVALAPIIGGKTYIWPQADTNKRWVMPSYAKSDWPWKRSLDVIHPGDPTAAAIAAALRTGPLMKKGLYNGPLFTWGYWPGNY